MSALTEFNQKVEACIRRKDGVGLRDLLRLTSLSATMAMEQYITKGGPLPTPTPGAWGDLSNIVKDRFAAGAALNANDWVACYEHLSKSLQAYIVALGSDDAWSVPLLHALCADLRVVAEQADEQMRSEGKKPSRLEDAERVLKRAFMATNNDRRPWEESSRKRGTLGVINQLLKIYFKLNNLRLCSNLTRTVNAPNFPPFESYSAQDRVTYKYYSGRLHLYDDRVADAAKDLTYAFRNMPQIEENNRRHVLLYLIPAQILSGVLPTEKMLLKFNMFWFLDITRAIRIGNLLLFEDAMEHYEEFFIRKALYLAVEKMRPLVYRSLCRRIHNVLGSKIPIDKVMMALTLCGKEMDRDELECVLANLIFNNYIKGYISHKVGFLVLSKKNPFPELGS